MTSQGPPGDALPAGDWLPRLMAAGVLVLCILPWINPFSFGPVPSVSPWLSCSIVVSAALLFCAPQKQAQPSVFDARWCLLAVAALAASALWPRAASLSPYEALALAGGLGLIALGAKLARQSLSISKPSWPFCCALLPWTVAGLVSAFLALLQYFGHADALAPWVNWAPPGEAFANLRQRNQFASLTGIALGALLAIGVLRHQSPSSAQHVALALAIVLLVVGNAASSSRTGLLQLLVLAAFALLWRCDARTLAWLGSMLAVYAIAMFALPWAAGLDGGMAVRLREGDRLCSSRLTLWSNVLDLIAARPWLGWGWGELDYAHYITLYDGPRFCDILDNAHNLPLHLAVELGVPAAVLVCGGVLVWVLRARPWRETDAVRRAAWMVLAVLAVHSLLEYPLWYGPFQLALGLCLGLLWRERASAGPAEAARRYLPAAVAVLALAAAGYAAWDYRRISQIYTAPELRLPAYREHTLAKLQDSWLFRRQVLFAELSMAEPAPDNALAVHGLATELLHFSPEARVIEKLLDSAMLLGLQTDVEYHLPRFRAAFPRDYADWVARQPAR